MGDEFRRRLPTFLSNAWQEGYPCYIYEGWQIATVYEKQELGNDRLV